MGCNAVAWRFHDLEREKRLANQRKLTKSSTFTAQNLDIGLTISEDQTKFQCKVKESGTYKPEIAIGLSPVDKHLVGMTNGKYLLEKETEAPNKTHEEKETKRLDSLEKAVEQNKLNLEKEMKRLSETNAKNIQNLKDEFRKRKLSKSNHYFRGKVTEISGDQKRPNQEFKIWDKNYWQSYIGQVCLLLQVIMYQIVLPDQFAKDTPYKVKDIEEDIDDEDLLNEEEREEASKRWENLKKQIRWDPSLERTLEMFEEKANSSMVRPECLTVEEAERAAEELNKQGRLRGRTSYEKVTKIIEMWRISADLVQSLQMNEQ